MDGTLRRSFVHLFTDRAIARELEEAGAAPEDWIGGHVLVRRNDPRRKRDGEDDK